MPHSVLFGYFRRTMVRFTSSLTLLAAVGVNHALAAPPGIAGFHSAAANFSFLLIEANAKDAMPRVSDPKVASALRAMTDVNAVLGSQRYEENDLPGLVDVCDRVNTVLSSYSAFGATELIPPNLDQANRQKALSRLMVDNSHAYQDEMTPLIGFTIACSARELAPLTGVIGKLSGEPLERFRKSTLVKIHLNLLSIVGNSLQVLADDKIREANKSRIADALLTNLDSYSAALPPADRKLLISTAQALSARASNTAKPVLTRVAASLQRQDCSGLCPMLSH